MKNKFWRAFNWKTSDNGGAWCEQFANAALAAKVLLPAEAKDHGKSENHDFIAELV